MVNKTYKARRAKQIGRDGQKEVREILLERFPVLGQRDITSRPMGSGGEDLMLSEAAYKVLPFDIEVKHAQKVNMIRACQQAAKEGRRDGMPVAIGCYRLEKPKKWYVCLELDDFLNLIEGDNDVG